MGVLQRFERRLEGMVEGAFARAFKSELQPVEVASAVQREMDDRAAIVAQGRTLVPNDFVVELAESDHDRLDVYAESLGVELANLARDYAKEQGYSFVGPVRMRFEGVPDMTTGTFRIRSGESRSVTAPKSRWAGPRWSSARIRWIAKMARAVVTPAAATKVQGRGHR